MSIFIGQRKMTHRLLLFIALIACWFNVLGQGSFNDSLARALQADSQRIYRKTLAKPFLRVENRNSFIIRQPVDFYGGLLGATLHDRHTIAVGYYFLENSRRREIVSERDPAVSQLFIRLAHFSFVYQYVLLNRRFIQVNVPIELGAGSYYARTKHNDEPGARHHSGLYMPINGGMQLIVKILPWIGLSGTGGYRYSTNDEVLLRFNGLYYSYGVWVDARQVLRNHLYRRAKRRYRQHLQLDK